MRKITIGLVIAIIALILGSAFYLLYNGLIWFNNPSTERYPVRGVDVSHYQGEIDWRVLSGQGIRFAFLKATEGSSSADETFARNLERASESGLTVGAYHFFSYDSPGGTQADNFIRTVPKRDDMLPPVVDVEYYGEYDTYPKFAGAVYPQLDLLLQKLEHHYGKAPIIYCTARSFDMYIRGRYDAYPLWIRDTTKFPMLPSGRDWTFWQYSDRQVLDGYQGEERFIDMNVFAGNQQQFEAFAQRKIEYLSEATDQEWSELDGARQY